MRELMLPFLAALALACSPGGGGSDAGGDVTTGGDGATGGCTTELDCPSVGDRCYFAIDAGCSTAGRTGKCMPYTAPASCTPNVACGCDGTTISECAPDGVVDRPSAGAGACPPSDDAGDDAATDAASDATGD